LNPKRAGPVRPGPVGRAKRLGEDASAPEGPAGRAVLLLMPIPSLMPAQPGRSFRAPSLGQPALPLRLARTLSAGRPGPRGCRDLVPARARAALSRQSRRRNSHSQGVVAAPASPTRLPRTAPALRRRAPSGVAARRDSARDVKRGPGHPGGVRARPCNRPPPPRAGRSRRRAGLCACSLARSPEAGLRQAPAGSLAARSMCLDAFWNGRAGGRLPPGGHSQGGLAAPSPSGPAGTCDPTRSPEPAAGHVRAGEWNWPAPLPRRLPPAPATAVVPRRTPPSTSAADPGRRRS
jgi:hypothetical protein